MGWLDNKLKKVYGCNVFFTFIKERLAHRDGWKRGKGVDRCFG